MQPPKLSICIPTYNRANYLDKLLNSIQLQINDFNHLVEIIVSDNASTDNTLDIIQKYKDIGLKFKYLKKDSNTGLDGNISNCFIQASGEYIWIIGDDDTIVHGGIAMVINTLMLEKRFAIIYVNSEICNKKIKPLCLDELNLEIVNKDKFAKEVHIWLTFISGNIVNKKMFLEHCQYKDLEPYMGTNLVLLKWAYSLLKIGVFFGLIKNTIILVEPDNSGGYKIFDVFVKKHFEIAHKELSAYPKIVKIIKKQTMINNTTLWLASYRSKQINYGKKHVANGFYQEETEKNINQILKEAYSSYFLYWITIYPLMKLPSSSVKTYNRFIMIFRKLYKFIFR